VYCDGRAERYNVEGEFGKKVVYKENAVEMLERELSKKRKDIRGYVVMGGGVGDSFQPVENETGMMRRLLEVMIRQRRPVHLITKATLITGYAELIEELHAVAGVLASFSFSSVDDRIGDIFEPGVPPPSERISAMRYLADKGIPVGMFLMPVLPYITDDETHIHGSVKAAKEAGASYVLFGGMTLKPGRQREHFLTILGRHYPHLIEPYHRMYGDDPYGSPARGTGADVHGIFKRATKDMGMPTRIPPSVLGSAITKNEHISTILGHLAHLRRTHARSYRKAAMTVASLPQPIDSLLTPPGDLDGIDTTANGIIQEYISTGQCRLLDTMICG